MKHSYFFIIIPILILFSINVYSQVIPDDFFDVQDFVFDGTRYFIAIRNTPDVPINEVEHIAMNFNYNGISDWQIPSLSDVDILHTAFEQNLIELNIGECPLCTELFYGDWHMSLYYRNNHKTITDNYLKTEMNYGLFILDKNFIIKKVSNFDINMKLSLDNDPYVYVYNEIDESKTEEKDILPNLRSKNKDYVARLILIHSSKENKP